jgi:type VI secretion system protein ImpH
MRRAADALTFLDALEREPYRFDFYQTLRRLECLHDERPRWGEALRPLHEPIRLGQEPDLMFAPAPLASFKVRDQAPPLLLVRLFGLCGPNGPLPIHLTEYVHNREHHEKDPTWSRFLDIFNHRFIALFYRAWARAQPHVNYDRPSGDRFAIYVGAFAGLASKPSRDRDAVPDLAKFFHIAALARQVRNSEGLGQILRHFFRVPIKIEEFVGHWLSLDEGQRTVLSSERAVLGAGAVLGRAVWDRQHKFRIRLGPLTLEQYERFLPGAAALRQLVSWVRLYLCFELEWDVALTLQASEVVRAQATLGGRQRLGWTTWLGARRSTAPADGLHLDAEAFAVRGGRAG